MPRSLSVRLGALVVACFAVAGAQAQQPATNPLDNIPERMPFDIPYGAPVSLEKADAVLNAALVESAKRGWKLICGVVDSGGHLVSFKRMDNAQIASIDIAIHKARASAKFRRETKVFETAMTMNNFTYIGTLDDVIASRGGIPLIEGGRLVGAIGCSGGTGSQDEVVARVGAALVK